MKATPGAIGYVKNAYAAPIGLATVQIRNHSGKFVKPERPNFYAAIDATDWTKPGFIVDMIDLDGIGDQHRIHLACENLVDNLHERSGIIRQGTPITRYTGHLRAAFG